MVDHPSIAVIVLDTLRDDLFHSFFDRLPGITFTNAYSTSNWTVPAHGSLFTGYYPNEIGVHSKSQTLDCKHATIAEKLKEKGYKTTKYTANLNIHAWDGWNRGFDVNIGPDDLKSYYDKNTVNFTEFKSRSNLSGVQLYLSALVECFHSDSSTIYSLLEGAKTVTNSYNRGGSRAVIQELSQSTFEDREFLFINLMDSHVPYYPPKDYRRLDRPIEANSWEPFLNGISNLEEVKIAYEDSVKYLSDTYQVIFDNLSNNFDYVITLSDHGELLGEYGMIEHLYGIYPQLVKIPLVISGRKIDDTEINQPVNILDVHATIADIAGVNVETRGQSLVQENIQSKDMLVEYNGFPPWVRDSFLQNGVSVQKYENLDTPLNGFIGRDGIYSFETHENGLIVEGDDQINVDKRRDRLDSLQSSIDQRRVNTERSDIDVDDSILSRLEDLGYA